MKKHSFKEWLVATRPWSFPASAMPVVVTLAYLYWLEQDMEWINGVWALVNIVLFRDVLWVAVPVGLITVAILHANNTRDIRTDSRADIRTLAMKLGGKMSMYVYCAEILLLFSLIFAVSFVIAALWS